MRVPGLPFGGAQRIELSLRDAQPALRHRRLRLDRREERHFVSLRIESAQGREEVHVAGGGRHPQLRDDRSGELDLALKRSGAESDAFADRGIARARLRAGRGLRERPPRRIEIETRPLRFAERPSRVARDALHGVVGGAHRDLDFRLALPAVVDVLQVAVEEFPLQRDALREEKGEEIRARLDLEPFLLRGDPQIPEDRAAQVQAEPAPVRHDERRDLYAIQPGAALLVPGAVQRALEKILDVLDAVRGELGGREARRPRVALARGEVGEGRVGIAVLVPQHAAVPPAPEKAAAENPALAGAVAVEIVGALPGEHRREMRRPLCGDHPLARGVIGDAEQAHLAAAPGLRRGPLDRVVEIAELRR